jgi:hypothetical protein
MRPMMFRPLCFGPMMFLPMLFGMFFFVFLASKLIFLLPILIGMLLLSSWGRDQRKRKETIGDDFYMDEKPKRKNDEIVDDRIDYV